MMHMFGSGYGGYSGWWIWMILRMGLGIAVFVGVMIWVSKMMKQNHYHRNSALQILDERFANGEMSEDEYIQKKKVMKDK